MAGDEPATRGAAGTRNVDLWLHDDALLVDLAGRYAGQDVDEYRELLAALSQYRRPVLDGAIVVLAADQLLQWQPHEVLERMRPVIEQYHTVSEQFGVVFPVWLCLTKCDLIAGFHDFFAELPAAERHKPLGVSLAYQARRADDIERTVLAAWQDVQQVLLSQRRRLLLSGPVKARAMLFPEQCRELLRRVALAGRAFGSSERADDNHGLLRGLFLTSSLPGDDQLESGWQACLYAAGFFAGKQQLF